MCTGMDVCCGKQTICQYTTNEDSIILCKWAGLPIGTFFWPLYPFRGGSWRLFQLHMGEGRVQAWRSHHGRALCEHLGLQVPCSRCPGALPCCQKTFQVLSAPGTQNFLLLRPVPDRLGYRRPYISISISNQIKTETLMSLFNWKPLIFFECIIWGKKRTILLTRSSGRFWKVFCMSW